MIAFGGLPGVGQIAFGHQVNDASSLSALPSTALEPLKLKLKGVPTTAQVKI
jgi:hypothetical protein